MTKNKWALWSLVAVGVGGTFAAFYAAMGKNAPTKPSPSASIAEGNSPLNSPEFENSAPIQNALAHPQPSHVSVETEQMLDMTAMLHQTEERPWDQVLLERTHQVLTAIQHDQFNYGLDLKNRPSEFQAQDRVLYETMIDFAIGPYLQKIETWKDGRIDIQRHMISMEQYTELKTTDAVNYEISAQRIFKGNRNSGTTAQWLNLNMPSRISVWYGKDNLHLAQISLEWGQNCEVQINSSRIKMAWRARAEWRYQNLTYCEFEVDTNRAQYMISYGTKDNEKPPANWPDQSWTNLDITNAQSLLDSIKIILPGADTNNTQQQLEREATYRARFVAPQKSR